MKLVDTKLRVALFWPRSIGIKFIVAGCNSFFLFFRSVVQVFIWWGNHRVYCMQYFMQHVSYLIHCSAICIAQLNLNAFKNNTEFRIDSLHLIIAAIKHAGFFFDTLPLMDGCVLCSFALDTLLARWTGLPVEGIPSQIRSRAHCFESIGN